MAGNSDASLDRRLRQAQKRLDRTTRKKPGSARVERLRRRVAKLTALRALPEAERPARLHLDLDLVKTALDVAQVALAATPVGPVLGAVKASLSVAKGLGKALADQDPAGAMDGVLDAVRAALRERGVDLDEDDEALAALMDRLEDQLDPLPG